MKEVAKQTSDFVGVFSWYFNIIALSVVPVARAMVEGWISERLEAMRCDVQ